MVEVGLLGGLLNLSLVGLVARAATIMGRNTGTIQDLEVLVQLANKRALAPMPIATMPRAHTQEALMPLRERKVMGRLVLVQG